MNAHIIRKVTGKKQDHELDLDASQGLMEQMRYIKPKEGQ